MILGSSGAQQHADRYVIPIFRNFVIYVHLRFERESENNELSGVRVYTRHLRAEGVKQT